MFFSVDSTHKNHQITPLCWQGQIKQPAYTWSPIGAYPTLAVNQDWQAAAELVTIQDLSQNDCTLSRCFLN